MKKILSIQEAFNEQILLTEPSLADTAVYWIFLLPPKNLSFAGRHTHKTKMLMEANKVL